LNNSSHENNEYILKVCTLLALTHTIIIEEKKGKIFYNASSPDELALVNAARHFGFEFLKRDEDNNMVVSFMGQEKKFKLLGVLEFSSARKRMSVIIEVDRKVQILCKGADSIILDRLEQKENDPLYKKTDEFLE
jgi:phospholipid-transporting ATPase